MGSEGGSTGGDTGMTDAEAAAAGLVGVQDMEGNTIGYADPTTGETVASASPGGSGAHVQNPATQTGGAAIASAGEEVKPVTPKKETPAGGTATEAKKRRRPSFMGLNESWFSGGGGVVKSLKEKLGE